MKRLLRTPPTHARAGIAILTVLLVLLALLVLCAPFLMTARNASRAGAQLADTAQGRLALDSAARYARSALGRSHPGVDETRWADDEQELALDVRLDPAALDPHDARGVMWDASAEDVSGRIDLNSAPPQVFANLLGASTRLNEAVEADAKQLVVASTRGFPETGYLWLERELVRYTAKDGTTFRGLLRGMASSGDSDGRATECGPQPAGSHAPGTPIIDHRAWAPVLWRLQGVGGELRPFVAPEHLRDASGPLAELDADSLRRLEQGGSVFAGVRGGPRWQRAARIQNSIRGGLDCELVLDQPRWFNEGTTVQVTDGRTTELGVVHQVVDGRVVLSEPLANDYEVLTAVARPLARRPVNVNTASAETLEALFAQLQLRGVNSRITRTEARALAGLVLESRPFTGLEDLLRRVVLPAAGLEALPDDAPVAPASVSSAGSMASTGAGGSLISAHDAIALYTNALNANDAKLSVSTLPLSFTTRDVYRLDLRASVNARSGVERSAARREQVEMVVPQGELLQVFAFQEDFDESLRLTREAPLWTTGPSATGRWDGGTAPPSRFWAHMGTHGGAPFVPGITRLEPGESGSAPPTAEHVFASREEGGWAQLEPSRVAELGERSGRVLHFDHETRDLEGRYLPDEPVLVPTNDPMVRWTPQQGDLLRALSFELWFQPRQLADGVLLDVGATSLETDRVLLALEGPDLVLRVLDGSGDHNETPLTEAAEARYAIAPSSTGGGGAGLAVDTWSHVHVDVRGTRPDQVTMLVDGSAQGVRVAGRTRLAAPLGEGDTIVRLEDDLGFPDRGTLRIGNELIEYVKTGANLLDASRSEGGANSGFGGRLARVDFELQSTGGVEPGQPTVLTSALLKTQHAAGTPVQLYGYSLPLASNVSNARGSLGSDLGLFAVGVLDGVVGGQGSTGDPINISIPTPSGPVSLPLGQGLAGAGSQVTGLVLRPADPTLSQGDLMTAFSTSGGYVALVQKRVTNASTQQGAASGGTSDAGDPVGGIEILRYSGHDDTTLFISQRAALPAGGAQQQVPHAFVSEWAAWSDPGGALDAQLEWHTFVVPVSLPVSISGGGLGFPQPLNGSEVAQITHLADAESTEWVRYDTIVGDQLVRNGADAMNPLYLALVRSLDGSITAVTNPGGGGGPGVPPGPDDGGSSSALVLGPSTPSAPVAQGGGGAYWNPYVTDASAPPDSQYPVTYAARTAMQFRGVCGTFPAKHAAGTPVLPAFRVFRMGLEGGLPGRHDTAFLHDGIPSSLGFPVHVHRTHRPLHHTYRPWEPVAGNPIQPVGGATVYVDEEPWMRGFTWVALQDAAPIPFSPGAINPAASQWETRELARLALHPTGERPRLVERAVLGASIRGGDTPAASIDEVIFGDTLVGDGTLAGPAVQGGQFVLTTDLAVGSSAFFVEPKGLRVARGVYFDTIDFLTELPQDAGLLRIGSEIVCYSSYDSGSGAVAIPAGGRALLGTEQEFHEAGETATFLDGWTVSVLAGSVSASGGTLPLADPEGFPNTGGTVRIDDELLHYTTLAGGALDMPRLSEQPGRMDRKGGGLFRGRFGTTPGGHAAGAVVVLHPFRYWDRWVERADAPELGYFGFHVDQPGAYWRNAFFEAEEPASGAARVGVLQRVTRRGDAAPAWDADPVGTRELLLLDEGLRDGVNPLGLQADRLEWRAFVEYQAGAFDPTTAVSHGWKQTPRLRVLGVTFLGPDLVLRRVDR